MKNETKDKYNNFWEFISDMHLYDTKGEALFKAILISFSWGGGVHMINPTNEITISIAANIFLFSIALIMEYAVQLVTTEKIATRIIPFLIVGISVICAFLTFCHLVENPFDININFIYNATIVTQIVIWLDVCIQLLIDKTSKIQIETNLKEVEVKE